MERHARPVRGEQSGDGAYRANQNFSGSSTRFQHAFQGFTVVDLASNVCADWPDIQELPHRGERQGHRQKLAVHRLVILVTYKAGRRSKCQDAAHRLAVPTLAIHGRRFITKDVTSPHLISFDQPMYNYPPGSARRRLGQSTPARRVR